MKPKQILFGLTAAILSLWTAACPKTYAESPTATAANKTLAPYFFIQSQDSNVDAMPLKSTAVEVKVAGVHITQVYSNAGGTPLEAIYVFPGSTRAAVYGMEMRIGERVLTAKIKERAEARRTYEEAKSAGKRSSLLEQQRPNVFQMNVVNIMPGDTVAVDLRYTEFRSACIPPLPGSLGTAASRPQGISGSRLSDRCHAIPCADKIYGDSKLHWRGPEIPS